MTSEEAINTLNSLKDYYNDKNEDSYVGFDDNDNEALDLAIKALEQQPNRCDSCVHSEEQDGSNCYECVKGMADNFETRSTDADCISREAIEKLKKYCLSYDTNTTIPKSDLFVKVNEIVDLPSVTPQQTRWIPVSERLPEHKGDYLVTFKLLFTYPVEVCYFDGQAWDKGQYDAVLAWMPLPKPYKESEKNVCKDCYYNDGEVHAECVICDKTERGE